MMISASIVWVSAKIKRRHMPEIYFGMRMQNFSGFVYLLLQGLFLITSLSVLREMGG